MSSGKPKIDATPLHRNQRKLSFSRISDPAAEAPPLTKLLSQYETLKLIAENLGTADLARLAATSKEHRMYLKGSETLATMMAERAVCNGMGIGYRARMFGHWNGKPENATVKCREDDAQPCQQCHVKVCNVCRYHIIYYDDRCDRCWEGTEEDIADAIDEIGMQDIPAIPQPPELHKVQQLCGDACKRWFCKDCEREEFGDLQVTSYHQALDEEELISGDAWCSCYGQVTVLYSLYHWLCLPCFLEAETEAARRRIFRHVYKFDRKRDDDGNLISTRQFVRTEYFCDCGKVAVKKGFIRCRWCGELVRPDWLDELP